jgi:DNA-binding response OmpR family regulator
MPTTKKILIVEDELPLMKALTEKFQQAQFTVFQATDGQSGLAAALKENPEMILLDILMPNMDGLEMLEKLRKDKNGKSIPVILLTNLGDMEYISQSVKLGISGYLVKSDWKLEEIVQKVKEKLSKNKSEIQQ